MDSALTVVEANSLSIPFIREASYPIRSGNIVRTLVDGEPAFLRICEAIDAARYSVWATIAFMWASFEMPDGRGSALNVLERAAARGLDVRLIFWRPDPETETFKRNAFWGSPHHIDILKSCCKNIRIRWDRAEPGFCQHQKSWLIDAGEETETAFLGGINLNPHSMVAPGHRGEGHNHDVYIELAGPSAVDVHHNFVQRWNEASERHLSDGRWGPGSETNLPFPTTVPSRRGDAIVQVQRTTHNGRYSDGHPTPSGAAFNIAAGERTIFDQYRIAIAAARRSIYIENQSVSVTEIVDDLRQALRRGVEVVLVLPAEQGDSANLADLNVFENFTLAGIAGLGADGLRKPVWVHAKLMIVDGEWATVGSCNLHRFSLFGNGEMNAACWDPDTVRALLSQLLQEHLDQDTSALGDRSALQVFRGIARDNRTRFDIGDHAWQGLAFSLGAAIVARSRNTTTPS
jgi:phosphatidylserine/phosphatidylglycerophosphate/cardiolipin synthase-like enzyme